MKRLVRYLFIMLLLPLAALAQEDEEDGGGFLTRTIEGALSGAGRDVKITGFAGALSSEATFDRMTIADAQGVWLTLDGVSLVWSRLALLRGRLEVDQLTAQSLEVARLPDPGEQPVEIPAAEAEEFSFQLPDLPVSINIAAFEVARIALGEPILGEPATLSLKATARLDDDGLLLDLAADRTDAVQGRFGVQATVKRDGAEIDINLRHQEAAEGIAARLLGLPGLPSVDLTVAGAGPLNDFVADIGLSTDGAPRLGGQVALSAEPTQAAETGVDRRIKADLGGDITALIAPEYNDFFGPDVGLSTETLLISDGSIDVQRFSLSARSVELEGKVQLNQDKWPTFVDVDGKIAQNGTPVVLPGSDAGVTVQSVTLDVSYDAAEGDAFAGVFDIVDLQHDAVEISATSLRMDGVLDANVDSVSRFGTDLVLDASGISTRDETMVDALGQVLKGGARIDYVQDQPIEISGLTLSGSDFGVTGDVVIQGLQDGFPTDLDVKVAAQDLSRFAGLVGQPVAGAVEVAVEGNVVPLSGMFDLKIAGTAWDLVVNIPQADAVLTGRTELSLEAARGVEGTFVRDLTLQNDALDVFANVALRSAGSDVEARVKLDDIALVLPQYQGAVSLMANAKQQETGWQVDADMTAPYDARASVSGLATGPSAEISFDLTIPETKPYAAQLEGPLNAKGRVWQAQGGYNVDVNADGPFGGAIDVEGLATGPDAKVNFNASLPDARVLLPEMGGAFALQGELAKAGNDWSIDSELTGPANLRAAIAGTAAADASTVDVSAKGQLPLGLAGPFIAPRSVEGNANFDLALRGAPSLEALSGRVSITDARFSAPNLRFGLQNIATQIDLANNTAQLDVDAKIVAGGRVSVDGSVNLASLAGDLALALQNAVIIDPNLYAATVSADVSMQGPLTGGARIAGTVNLSEVNVTVPGTGVTAIGAIPEINHVRASAGVTATRARAGVIPPETKPGTSRNAPPYPLAVTINAPSKIFVRGRGINAELGGDLEVTGDTNNIVSAGSFDLIRGRLDIIGKRFELDEGSIQFQGAVTPYIRFVTTTQTPDGTASIAVDGLANEPEITFSAEPEAPEDEVMSLILFGRYVSELSAFQALQLANGVSQLTGRGGIGIVGGLREGIGVDELDVSTDEEGSTSVSAGKYITDEIYTDVTSNSESGTDISLNIDLTRDLKGRATVAEDGDGSIGLFFERDY